MADKNQQSTHEIKHVCSVCGHILDKNEEYCEDHPNDQMLSIRTPRDADKYEQMHK